MKSAQAEKAWSLVKEPIQVTMGLRQATPPFSLAYIHSIVSFHQRVSLPIHVHLFYNQKSTRAAQYIAKLSAKAIAKNKY